MPHTKPRKGREAAVTLRPAGESASATKMAAPRPHTRSGSSSVPRRPLATAAASAEQNSACADRPTGRCSPPSRSHPSQSIGACARREALRSPRRMRTAPLWKQPEGAGEECVAAGRLRRRGRGRGQLTGEAGAECRLAAAVGAVTVAAAAWRGGRKGLGPGPREALWRPPSLLSGAR